MQPQAPPQRRIVVLGGGGAGKSMLTLMYVTDHWVEEYDPTIEDDYRKQVELDGVRTVLCIFDTAGNEEFSALRDQYYRTGEWFLVLAVGNDLSRFERWDREEVEREANMIRRIKDLDDHVPLPAFLVVSKCDLPRAVPRQELIDLAIKCKFQGYYETSAKTRINVQEVFLDAARRCVSASVGHEKAAARRQLEKVSGFSGLLPWNWSKKAKWDSEFKRLQFASDQNPTLAAQAQKMSIQDIDTYRFPEPELTRTPVAFYNDLRQLIEVPDGVALSDVALIGDDENAEPIKAHKIVLCIGCDTLAKIVMASKETGNVKVEGVSTAVLKQVVHFLYTDQFPSHALKEMFEEAARTLGLPVLAAIMDKKAGARTIASSEAVEKQMTPALSSDFARKLSDVTITVGKKEFKLHRALLWARSSWFRALLAERWKKSSEPTAIEVTAMPAEVLCVVVEFLYTGRARISPELALDVLVAADMLNLPRLVQLAEFALQPVIDAGNAVPLYLAAQAYGAKQLGELCEYWMAVDVAESKRHEQWSELKGDVRARVEAEHQRLEEARAKKREEKKLMEKLPCLFAQIVPAPPPAAAKGKK